MRFAAALGLSLAFALPFGACGEGQSRSTPDPIREVAAPPPLPAEQSESRSSAAGPVQTTATSSFGARGGGESSCMQTSTVTRRFTPAFLVSYPEEHVDSPLRERLLLTETLELEQIEQREGVCAHEGGGIEGKLSVVAAPLTERGIGQPAWSFEARSYHGVAPAGDLWPFAQGPAFYRVSYDRLGVYHSLRTGKQLFASTSRLLRVEIPRSPFRWRFIAFHDGRASPPPPEAGCDEEQAMRGECDEKLVGVLQYGDDERVFQRLVLVSDRPLQREHTSIALVLNGRETHWSWGFLDAEGTIDRRQISGFGVAIELYSSQWKNAPPVRIEVPVKWDEFDVDAARLPPGVRIRR